MSDLSPLIKHTTTYRQLKPIYEEYKKSRDKEKYLRGHESEIILFEAAAKALQEMQEYGIVKKNIDSILYPSQSKAREQDR